MFTRISVSIRSRSLALRRCSVLGNDMIKCANDHLRFGGSTEDSLPSHVKLHRKSNRADIHFPASLDFELAFTRSPSYGIDQCRH
jgi:hypothetical protein